MLSLTTVLRITSLQYLWVGCFLARVVLFIPVSLFTCVNFLIVHHQGSFHSLHRRKTLNSSPPRFFFSSMIIFLASVKTKGLTGQCKARCA